MKRVAVIFVLFFYGSLLGAFEGIETLFVKANTAYKENDMLQAQKYYLQIIQQGFCNGFVFYNLGNTFLRQGKTGEAILYYELAKKWIPRDPELQENYRIAREPLSLKDSSIPMFFQVVFSWHFYTSLNEEFLLAFIFFLLGLLALYFRGRQNKSWRFPVLFFIFFAWVMMLSGSLYKIYQECYQISAVLTGNQVKVYFGPSTSQERIQAIQGKIQTDLQLNSGLLFFIENITQNEGEEWWQARFENGVRGWVPAYQARKIQFP
ncbi:MAG: SH3 domain-containing protein [Planctomycetota bacterium]